MHILDSDYIELEGLRRAQLAAQQWQIVTKISKDDIRRGHLKFVYKIYLISLLLLVLVAAQWWVLTEIKAVQQFLIIYNYILLTIVFVHFLIITLMQYMLRYKTERSKYIVIIYIFLMVEFASMTVCRPMVESDVYTFSYAMLFTLAMWGISFILAALGQTDMDHSTVYLSMWSQRYYLATSTSLIMTMDFSFITTQISISLFMIFFISIFFVIWGRSMGSMKFYQEERKFCKYYTLLNFLNIISLYAHSIILLIRIRDQKYYPT